ncbi:pollen-specific leucine-rich repeat extensin-like protein 3 [Iris pallida]|uniref:Pollen-specific leucine-rich repeat extensin-like protein 3 n=1 Tax=Iris pallida TaxID=29817 RepID=A0AAX6FEF1_IRIPA|nr:pollen-specific leucine-rich repeat extensin-like protein 3 [Iris pallida]
MPCYRTREMAIDEIDGCAPPCGGVAPGRRGRFCWRRHRLEGAVAPQLRRPEDDLPVISGGEKKLGGNAGRTAVGVVQRIGGARGGRIGAFRRFWTTAVMMDLGASTATRVVLIVAGMVAPEFESARGNTTGNGCEGSINHCRVGSAAAARRTPAGTGGRWSRAASVSVRQFPFSFLSFCAGCWDVRVGLSTRTR